MAHQNSQWHWFAVSYWTD